MPPVMAGAAQLPQTWGHMEWVRWCFCCGGSYWCCLARVGPRTRAAPLSALNAGPSETLRAPLYIYVRTHPCTSCTTAPTCGEPAGMAAAGSCALQHGGACSLMWAASLCMQCLGAGTTPFCYGAQRTPPHQCISCLPDQLTIPQTAPAAMPRMYPFTALWRQGLAATFMAVHAVPARHPIHMQPCHTQPLTHSAHLYLLRDTAPRPAAHVLTALEPAWSIYAHVGGGCAAAADLSLSQSLPLSAFLSGEWSGFFHLVQCYVLPTKHLCLHACVVKEWQNY